MNDLEGASSLLSQMGLGPLGGASEGGRSSGNGSVSSPLTGNSTSTTASAPTNNSKKDDSSTTSSNNKAGNGASSSSKPSVQLQDLQKILSGMQQPPSGRYFIF